MKQLTDEERVAWHEGRLTIDPFRLVHDLVKAGDYYADKDAAANILEETKGSVLGQMVQASIQAKHSATAAEHFGKASGMYRQHVNQMVEARRVALRAKVAYEAQKTFIDLVRTKEASKRAEMRAGGVVP